MTGAGTRMRRAAGLSGDVVGRLERGRVLRVMELGPEEEIGGATAHWLRLDDAFAPPREDAPPGWAFGALLRPAPAPLPAGVTASGLRVLLDRPDDIEGGMWGMKTEEGRLRVRRWSGSESAGELEVPGWSSLGESPTLEVAKGEQRLWVTGRTGDGRTGLLISPLEPTAPLRIALEADSGRTAGELMLEDLDGDGRREALHLLRFREEPGGEVIAREYRAYRLDADGTAVPLPDLTSRRSSLLPAADPALAALRYDAEGRSIVAEIVNHGMAAPAGRLGVVVTFAEGSRQLFGEVPALLPKERTEVRLPLDGRAGTPLRLEGTVVPMGVEERLSNNRLAVDLKEAR